MALPDPPAGRFLVAFNDPTLTWAPTWTALDQAYPSLVASYTIDRGRQYELDRTDTGRATVTINDKDGILDPTNSEGPFYNKLEPLKQAMIGRRNPANGRWYTRFRGFIEEFDYTIHPSQKFNQLTVQLVDLFEILAAIEMQPGEFGDAPPASLQAGSIFFDNYDRVVDRMRAIYLDANLPVDTSPGVGFFVTFSGNVSLFETVYSAGEGVMTALQDCADAEMPGVGNLFCDRLPRFGRLVFHGRRAKFDPDTIAASAGTTVWDYSNWHAGDGQAVNADPTHVAHVREFGYERGLSKIINQAKATPLFSNAGGGQGVPLTAAEDQAQLVKDTTSIGLRGIRSWSTENLITEKSNVPGDTGGDNSLKETKRFAAYYKDNYATPHNRINAITFRSINPAAPGGAANWQLLSQLDISDSIDVTIGSPGVVGFSADGYFIEGVHEEVHPLGTDGYDDVTMRLDLSPRAYFDTNPWA